MKTRFSHTAHTSNVLAILATILLASGCANQRALTSSLVALPADGTPTPGVFYFLPRAVVNVTIERKLVESNNTLVDTLIVSEPEFLPDPKHAYHLNYNPSIFSDDAVVVEANAKGLLTAVNSETEDKSGVFVSKLFELATEASKAFVPRGLSPSVNKPFKLVTKIDPTDTNDLNRIQAMLDSKNAGLNFTMARSGFEKGSALAPDDPGSCQSSICFRPALPYRLSLEQQNGGAIIGEVVVLVPNEARLLGIDLNRANFVKNHTKLEFANGMLTKFDINKPSEALGFIQIPIDIAKAIVSIPSAMLQFKTTSAQEKTGEIDAQVSLLESQKQLIDAQRKAAEAALDGRK